ncbi:MAG: membrane protein insertase YidC [Lachnospiraceae bacterium]|nr:membrane protein insertase YidC [Lachnospiraceae bacterium]
MSYLYLFLSFVMDWCYGLCNSYGWAIVLFTFLSKIVLLPVSLWTYMNSITMIKIQPDINFLKVKYYGQKDVIAEEQAKLFKEKKYHPLASTIPLFIQLVLLMGVVGAIRSGIENPAIDMSFGPMDLGMVPNENGVSLLWSPAIAGFSAWILCIAQNASNVLQSEQSKYNKYGTMIFSVGLSLYLGWYVPIGTALYWICSNLMAVIQLYILNGIIKPRRFVDYEKLEKSREALNEIQSVGKKQKNGMFSDNKRRERRDYKRFFSVVNKHLVFYSESNGFYKYFKGIIEYLLLHTNIIIHYITSDPNDAIFELEKDNAQIKAYYIGENRLITLMMKMDADMVVMTMPDLENYHIKRSYVRGDVEYVFVQHGVGSNNMGMRKGCMDHFDTIFCAGPHQAEEIRETEKVYGLAPKKLIEVGYPLIDEIRENYQALPHVEHARKKILIAPSWQDHNIVDSCLEDILDKLSNKGYEIIVRPHPQEVRLKKEKMEILKQKYDSDDITIQTDFTSNNPVMEADLLITDWSGISWEYAFTTHRPILFINTPMKVMNPEYQKISTVPLNILLRNKLGRSLEPDQTDKVAETVEYLIGHTAEYRKEIEALAQEYLFNPGFSAEVGAKYIIESIQEKISRKGAGA